jgi:hypothetical protein
VRAVGHWLKSVIPDSLPNTARKLIGQKLPAKFMRSQRAKIYYGDSPFFYTVAGAFSPF